MLRPKYFLLSPHILQVKIYLKLTSMHKIVIYSCCKLDINNQGQDIMAGFCDNSKEPLGCVKAENIIVISMSGNSKIYLC
jgi:hypothetical protein